MRCCHFLLLLISFHSFSQDATVKEKVRPVVTYAFSDPDPVAHFGRMYPYNRYDGYAHKGEVKNWKFEELQNAFIHIGITPEIGGKVWEAFENSTGRPFLYSNGVVKFRDIAIRGPWTSGGIEFNFGDIGHSPTASAPVDYFVRTNPDGSVSCFIGATDWSARTTWRVEINLPKDKAFFTTTSWWTNTTPFEQEYYHWTNAGYQAAGDLELVFPGTNYIGHEGEVSAWPIDSLGHHISFYEQNNFGPYKSYHVLGKATAFYGGFLHKFNSGVGHWSPYYQKPGKKAWIWGLSRQGMIWENLLTDKDGQYVEVQSGRMFNQASEGSIVSPFKHLGFQPYAADTWTEYWYPVKGTRGMTNGSSHGALNLRTEGEFLKIAWMPLEFQTDTLIVSTADRVLIKKPFSLKPLQVFNDSVRWSGETGQLTVKIGKDVFKNDSSENVHRPLYAPADFDWNSDYGLALKGADLYKQKSYGEAERLLTMALVKNPNIIPALTLMAQIRFRQGNFVGSKKFAGKALAVNTYDGEANYWWGLASEKTGGRADAKDGLSIAAMAPAWRAVAYLRLSWLSVAAKNWQEADDLITTGLQFGSENVLAIHTKLLLLRKLGRTAEALKLIEHNLEKDPIDHFSRFERFRITGKEEDKNEFIKLIRQEMPWETFIELSLQYDQWNLTDEALQLIKLSPDFPMVGLWRAWLENKSGDISSAKAALNKIEDQSETGVFPFRPELYPVFQWADKTTPNWKWKYYEALTRFQFNETTAALALFDACGDQPKDAAFYLNKAVVLGKDRQEDQQLALEKAYQLEPASWRTGFLLAANEIRNQQYDKALSIAEKNYKTNPQNYMIGLQLANVLYRLKKYSAAGLLLDKLDMLPAEQQVDAHRLFREVNIRVAVEDINARHFKQALASIKKSETWPERLGSGEPYDPDNRFTQFLAAVCYDRLNDQAKKESALTYIGNFKASGRNATAGNSLTTLVSGGEKNTNQLLLRVAAGNGFDGEMISSLKKK